MREHADFDFTVGRWLLSNVRIAHAQVLSDTARCPMVTSNSACRTTVPGTHMCKSLGLSLEQGLKFTGYLHVMLQATQRLLTTYVSTVFTYMCKLQGLVQEQGRYFMGYLHVIQKKMVSSRGTSFLRTCFVRRLEQTKTENIK